MPGKVQGLQHCMWKLASEQICTDAYNFVASYKDSKDSWTANRPEDWYCPYGKQ